ncbi:nicotinate phosphoribosyltransferase [Hanamia caeni]|uniref:Nicotinate phosphoribosyltransferase n=1 Tax=Hanamia caeni TaxID=2294116 RepID=A0A3M9NIY2_9BACT|nr:nicotinate phosphoribosyltransferase [Hanamia caeni]RNI37415.1 nicotinate phosphoribosyltransferase [Hanamia caeni]
MPEQNRFTIHTNSGLYTDMYELAMAEAYFKEKKHNEPACFDYFFRKLPFGGGYVIFCGLGELLPIIETLHFNADEINWLHKQGFNKDFLSWLEAFRFKGTIRSMQEGEIVFPLEPLLEVEGGLAEVQIIETLLLNYLNFQSLIATKAARMRFAAGNRHLSEFGLRRAQALGGISASRAAVAGGFDSTSNMYSAKKYDIKAVGTMAHSFIQSQQDELTAFRKFAEAEPHNCTLLVDTYDTLKSGIPNAIKVAKEMTEKGLHLQAIRLDSGDLAYLSKRGRKMLDDAGFSNVQIIVSNQLDEYLIKSLLEQKAPIDSFGVGTSLATGQPDAALDGVYKLCEINGEPKIKLSENIQKVTLPGRKQVYRFSDETGCFVADAIGLEKDTAPDKMIHPFDVEKSMQLDIKMAAPLLEKIMENGHSLLEKYEPEDIAAFVKKRMRQLPDEHKRFNNPHIYKVGVSAPLHKLRSDLRKRYKM